MDVQNAARNFSTDSRTFTTCARKVRAWSITSILGPIWRGSARLKSRSGTRGRFSFGMAKLFWKKGKGPSREARREGERCHGPRVQSGLIDRRSKGRVRIPSGPVHPRLASRIDLNPSPGSGKANASGPDAHVATLTHVWGVAQVLAGLTHGLVLPVH